MVLKSSRGTQKKLSYSISGSSPFLIISVISHSSVKMIDWFFFFFITLKLEQYCSLSENFDYKVSECCFTLSFFFAFQQLGHLVFRLNLNSYLMFIWLCCGPKCYRAKWFIPVLYDEGGNGIIHGFTDSSVRKWARLWSLCVKALSLTAQFFYFLTTNSSINKRFLSNFWLLNSCPHLLPTLNLLFLYCYKLRAGARAHKGRSVTSQ